MSNLHPTVDAWLEIGYKLFALEGPQAVQIEKMARFIRISKSSFYHHFADLEVFLEKLLEQHYIQACLIGEKEQSATCIDPDLIQVLVAHKTDLLFNRQLRFHRQRDQFDVLLKRADGAISSSFVHLLVKELNPKLSEDQLEGFFGLALENFFLQINANNLNDDWLRCYFSQLRDVLSLFH